MEIDPGAQTSVPLMHRDDLRTQDERAALRGLLSSQLRVLLRVVKLQRLHERLQPPLALSAQDVQQPACGRETLLRVNVPLQVKQEWGGHKNLLLVRILSLLFTPPCLSSLSPAGLCSGIGPSFALWFSCIIIILTLSPRGSVCLSSGLSPALLMRRGYWVEFSTSSSSCSSITLHWRRYGVSLAGLRMRVSLCLTPSTRSHSSSQRSSDQGGKGCTSSEATSPSSAHTATPAGKCVCYCGKCLFICAFQPLTVFF